MFSLVINDELSAFSITTDMPRHSCCLASLSAHIPVAINAVSSTVIAVMYSAILMLLFNFTLRLSVFYDFTYLR